MADGRLWALLLLAGGAAAIAASNCFVQGYEITPPTPLDAGPDASGGSSSCGHATWPPPPMPAIPRPKTWIW